VAKKGTPAVSGNQLLSILWFTASLPLHPYNYSPLLRSSSPWLYRIIFICARHKWMPLKLYRDEKFRKEVVEKVGTGFEIPAVVRIVRKSKKK
jgi:hypothetical protein